MSEIKITDLVPQETIDNIKNLDKELKTTVETYTSVAKEMAKGLQVDVKVVGDLGVLEKIYNDNVRKAAELTEELRKKTEQYNQALQQTSPVISRNLMEIERSNKAHRDEYTGLDKARKILDDYNDSYKEQTKALVVLQTNLDNIKSKMSDNTKAYRNNLITEEEYIRTQSELTARYRDLSAQKAKLTSVMKAEEKQALVTDDSIAGMSQTLELLKKSYKELSAEGRESEVGKAMEREIQELDAHLKDLSADIGEFQRNVGNYAIAGQNGVVATESLTAAIDREAVTLQDVIDQTKILTEARNMLDRNDEHYEETLAKLDAKLEENRRRLSDVSDILGKEAKTVAEAESQNKRLAEAIKHVDLKSADAKQRLEELRGQIERNNRIIADATGTNEEYADSILGIIGINGNLGSSFKSLGQSGNFIEGLNTKAKAFFKTLIGMVSNPWILTFLGIAGAGAAFKWWYEYNKGLIEASKLTRNFTGVVGEAADKITTDLQTAADHMGKGFNETINAANVLVNQFGITWEEAIQRIEDGIVSGADMNGELLSMIEKYSGAFKDAGVEADQFIAILSQTRNGIFDENGLKAITDAGMRIRSMSSKAEESLKAIGISAKKMQDDLRDGNITMLEAIQQVTDKLKELPPNAQETGDVMMNVFGRKSAKAGEELLKSISDISDSLDDAKKDMGEYGKVVDEQLKAQKDLNETIAAVFKMSGTSFEEMSIKAKTFITQGLANIVKWCVEIANKIIRMYNEAIAFRMVIGLVVSVFKTLWDVIKMVGTLALNTFNAIGGVVKGLMMVLSGEITDGYKKMYDSVTEGFANLGKSLVKTAKEIGSDFADTFSGAVDDQIKELKTKLDESGLKLGVSKEVVTDYAETPEEELSDKEKKELEKQAQERLKTLAKLEESKIAIMEEGHEKELALIRVKFLKKLAEIKGQTEEEKALRVQLIEEMQKELSECELKYQKELTKINLENRLAAVKKGSKAELDVRLAQLEMNMQSEIESAAKTGADVNLIREKYEKQRAELESGYANERAEKIQEGYAVEEIMRNQQYSDAVNALKERYAKEMALASGNASKQEKLKKELDDNLFELDLEYSKKSVEAAVDMIEEILKLENMSAEDREKWERELANAKIALSNEIADANKESVERQIADDEKLREKRKANLQNWLSVASDVIGNVSALVNAVFDSKIDKIEEEQEANEEAGEKEQERISELVSKKVITEEEGEARKRAAEAQTAKKNEELEKKKAQLQHKQAVFQKATDLAQAGISTALAITNALTTSPFPLGLAMAAIAGAMGAVQIATILATPIPKYAKGTDYHKGGPAIVGDGGRQEIVLYNGSAWITPDSPTLVDIPRGAVVIPSTEAIDTDKMEILNRYSKTDLMTFEQKAYDDSRMRQSVSELIYLIRMQTKQQHLDAYLKNHHLFSDQKL